jgi:hypothetical protein
MLSQAHLRNSNPSLDGPAFGAVTSGFLLGWPVLAAIGLGSLALLLGALAKAALTGSWIGAEPLMISLTGFGLAALGLLLRHRAAQAAEWHACRQSWR